MTTDLQREALKLLAEVWALSPDVRLGQLMAHLDFLGEGHLGRTLGYIDDDELLRILQLHKTELENRTQDSTNPRMATAKVVEAKATV